jgi:small neutral amino acid transporter SnatA (MarC family)
MEQSHEKEKDIFNLHPVVFPLIATPYIATIASSMEQSQEREKNIFFTSILLFFSSL